MVTPVIGLPQFSGWAQVVVTADHTLIVALAVSGTNARNVGRELAESIRDAQISQPAQFHSLLESLQAEVAQKECQLGFSAGYFQPDVATFGVLNGKVLLKRTDKVGTLLHGSDELLVIQGQLHEGDVVVFFTEQARRFEEEITQKLHQGFDIDTIVTSVVPGLHSSDDSSQSAIGFLHYDQQSTLETDQDVLTTNSSEEIDTDEADFARTPSFFDATADEISTQTVDEASDGSGFESSIFDDSNQTEAAVELADLENQDELSYERLQTAASWQPNRPLFIDDSDDVQTEHIAQSESSVTKKLSLVSRADIATKLQPFLNKIGGGLWTKLKVIFAVVAGFFARLSSNNKAVYVGQPSARKLARVVVPVALGILIVGGGIAAWSWQRQQAVSAAEAVVAPLEAQFVEAKTVVETNPIQARKSIEEVIEKLTTLSTEFEKEPTTKKLINAKISEIETYFQSISGREEFSVLPTFYNLRLAQEGFIVTAADLAGSQAVFLDGGQQKIVVLNLDTKEQRVLDVSAAGEVFDIAFDGNRVFLLAEQGLFSQKIESSELVKLRGTETALEAARQLDIFGTTIYVVNADQRNVFRFAQNDAGNYDAGTGWIKSAPGLSFDQVTQLQIDGNIWLASKDGSIRQYRTGTDQDFTIVGLSEPLSDSVTFFTDEDDINVYVLESAKNRVVVLNKNGEFVKEIKSGSLATATVVVANETKKKIYAISGAEVFEISLE